MEDRLQSWEELLTSTFAEFRRTTTRIVSRAARLYLLGRIRPAILLVPVAVVLLLAIFGFPALFNSPGRVAKAFGSAIGRDIIIGSMDVRTLPVPSIVLSDVVIPELPEFGTEPTLRAEEMILTLNLASLWRGRLETERISFRHPIVNLVRTADGRWNVGALLARIPETRVAPTEVHVDLRRRFPSIDANGGQINVTDNHGVTIYTLNGVEVGLVLASRDNWRGTLRAISLVAGPLTVKQMNVDILRHDGIVELNDLHANIGGGSYSASWLINLHGRSAMYSSRGTIDGIDVAQITSLPGPDWAGKLSASYYLKASGSTWQTLVESAEGHADFQWRNGLLGNLRLDSQSEPVRFQEFSGNLSISDGSVKLADCIMAADPRTYQVSGTASLAGRLELRFYDGRISYLVSGGVEQPRVTVVGRGPRTVPRK